MLVESTKITNDIPRIIIYYHTGWPSTPVDYIAVRSSAKAVFTLYTFVANMNGSLPRPWKTGRDQLNTVNWARKNFLIQHKCFLTFCKPKYKGKLFQIIVLYVLMWDHLGKELTLPFLKMYLFIFLLLWSLLAKSSLHIKNGSGKCI